jgi:hypothetical protein
MPVPLRGNPGKKGVLIPTFFPILNDHHVYLLLRSRLEDMRIVSIAIAAREFVLRTLALVLPVKMVPYVFPPFP